MKDTIAQLAAVVLLSVLGGLVFVGVEGFAYLITPNDYVIPPASALPAVFSVASFVVLACGLFIGLPVVIILRKLNLTGLLPLVLTGGASAFVVAMLLSRTGLGGLPFFATATFVGASMGALWWALIERRTRVHD